MKLELRPHPSSVRCVLCHGDDGELETCAGCNARIHLDCRQSIERCPTLGCGTERPLRTALEVAEGRGTERLYRERVEPFMERASDRALRDLIEEVESRSDQDEDVPSPLVLLWKAIGYLSGFAAALYVVLWLLGATRQP